MKKLITILVLSSAMLSACEGDPEFVPKTSVEAKIHELMIGYDGKIDMTVFIADAQRGVWLIDDIDITYTNGKTESGVMDGAALMNSIFPLVYAVHSLRLCIFPARRYIRKAINGVSAVK